MQNIAADRHGQAFKLAEFAANGEGIEQRLCGVLMLAIAGIDHRTTHFLRQQFHRARRLMPHHQKIRVHGIDGHGRVENRFTLGNGGRGNRHIHHISAQPLSGNFKRALGAGGGFEEQVDLCEPSENRMALLGPAIHVDISVGEIEKNRDFKRGKIADPQKVRGFEERSAGLGRCH
jgi:hypothetical protein